MHLILRPDKTYKTQISIIHTYHTYLYRTRFWKAQYQKHRIILMDHNLIEF